MNKKINIGIIAGICSILIIVLILFLSSSGEKILRFRDSKVGGYVDLSNTEIVISTEVNLKSTYNVYKINKTMSKSEINKIKKAFGMQDTTGDDNVYTSGQNTLRIDSCGNIYFSGYLDVDYGINDKRSVAEKFLKDRDLLPDDFTFSSVSDNYVFFTRTIDGMKVDGNSIYVVTTGSQIQAVSFSSDKIAKSSAISIKTFDEAVQDLKSGFRCLTIEKDGKAIDEIKNPKKMSIDNVEVVYLSGSYDDMQKHIQPIYTLKGTIIDNNGESYNFSTRLSALPNDMVYDVT